MPSIGHAAHWQGIEERVVISWFACLCIRSKLRSSSLTVIFNTKLRVFSLLSLVPLCLFTVQGVRGGWCTPVNKQRSCSSMSWVRYTSMKFREIRDTSAKYVPLFLLLFDHTNAAVCSLNLCNKISITAVYSSAKVYNGGHLPIQFRIEWLIHWSKVSWFDLTLYLTLNFSRSVGTFLTEHCHF